MKTSLRSKPVAIALLGLLVATTAALAAIHIAPKAVTDSVTVYADKPHGQVILSHQDGSVALDQKCKSFPCRIDISSLHKGEYNVKIRNGDDVMKMVSLYKD